MNYGIGNVKDKSKSLFTTTTAPTESGGVITLATTDIVESGFKVGDYLAYVDSGNISALYSISAISSGTATLSLVGAFGGGGGKQLYQHNMFVAGSQQTSVGITLISDSPNAMSYNDLVAWLTNKGFNEWDKVYPVTGVVCVNNVVYTAVWIYYDSSSSKIKCTYVSSASSGLTTNLYTYLVSSYGADKVIAL